MVKIKKALARVLLITTTVFVVFCVMDYSLPQVNAAEDTIKVGVPVPLTGRHAAFGKRIHNGYEVALSHINAEGGVNGKKIQLIYEDTIGEPKNSMAVSKKLITQTKVPILMGEFSSAATIAGAQVAQAYKIPYLCSIAAADDLTRSGWDWIFRVHPANSDYAGAVAGFWKAVGLPKSTVIIHEETLWGSSLATAMERFCKQNGIKVLLKESYEGGILDLKPLLMRIKALNPQVIFTTSYLLDGALFMRQAKEINLNADAFFGSGSETSPEYLQAAGNACDHQYTIDWFNKSLPFPGVKRFYDDYVKKFNEEPVYHSALSYASVQVLADVLRRTKSLNNEDIKKALETADVMTIVGQVKFENYDGFLHQDKPVILLSQWQKGKLFPVFPKEAATAKYIYPVPKWGDK